MCAMTTVLIKYTDPVFCLWVPDPEAPDADVD
jgi:hypothetical protein